MPGLDLTGPGLQHDPHWYRKAVFYEVLVRAFADSNGSGSGDFNGLISKLDYIQWLGVDCLWVPPFYASPLRDGGYDISDYCAVLPEFGTLPDFQELVAQAHARGLRVITDLAVNHTSDAHPWFQASRSDPEGPYGDFYVWSDYRREVRRRADHLRRHRDEQLDVRPGPAAVLLAPLLLPPARPQLRQPGGPGGDHRRRPLLDGPRHRRHPPRRDPLPVRGARGRTARTCPRRTTSSGASGAWSTSTTRGGSCWPRPTSGPRTWSSTSAPSPSPSATWRSTSR